MSQSQPPGSPGIHSGTSQPGAGAATATASRPGDSALEVWSSGAPGATEPAPVSRTSTLMVVAPLFGPVGRRRHPAAVVALSIASLGLYALIWHGRITREIAGLGLRLLEATRRTPQLRTSPKDAEPTLSRSGPLTTGVFCISIPILAIPPICSS